MKKSLRIASILLVLVLVTSCFVGGTFAKYVTKGNQASETARVAKWGVNFIGGTDDLFSAEYATDDTANYATMTYSVKADTNVVAPGTAGTGYTFGVTGTPEVSYEVQFDINDAVTEDIFLEDYHPVNFYVTTNGTKSAAMTLEDALAALNAYSYYFDVTDGKYYVNGTETTAANAMNVALEWDWTFFVDDDTDVLDTQLGDIAAGEPDAIGTLVAGTDYNLKIAFDITATATQID